jgi:hypothetical protein
MRGGRPRCRSAFGGLALAFLLLATARVAKADELPLLGNDQPPAPARHDPPTPPAPTPTPPEQPPTIGSFPRSFVIPGTETSVTISGSVQTNFRFGNSH